MRMLTADVYQITDIESVDYAFRMFDPKMFHLKDYKKVCTLEVKTNKPPMDILEDIFSLLNASYGPLPEDYTGHSCSVSDVVVLNGRVYYCNPFAWMDVGDFDGIK